MENSHFLFHYTSISALMEILKDNKIIFNNINNVNDTYESKVFDINDIENEIYYKWDLEKGQYQNKFDELKEELDDRLLNYYEIMYFEGRQKAKHFKLKYINPLLDKYRYYKRKLSENNKHDVNINKISIFNRYHEFRKEGYLNLRKGLVKTACFSIGDFNINEFNEKGALNRRQGFFHPRMWAQYAEKSNGCCIIFGKDIFLTLLKEASDEYYIFEGLMKYVDLLNINNISNYYEIILDVYNDLSKRGIINYLIKNVDTLFFRKDIDWSDEKEYRILLINKLKNKKKKPFNMDIKNAINSIILGEKYLSRKTVVSDHNFIIDKCKKNNIDLYTLKNNLGNYSLLYTYKTNKC